MQILVKYLEYINCLYITDFRYFGLEMIMAVELYLFFLVCPNNAIYHTSLQTRTSNKPTKTFKSRETFCFWHKCRMAKFSREQDVI